MKTPYTQGLTSGKRHWDPIPNTTEEAARLIRSENLRKAALAMADRRTSDAVADYWRGYLDAMEAANPLNPEP